VLTVRGQLVGRGDSAIENPGAELTVVWQRSASAVGAPHVPRAVRAIRIWRRRLWSSRRSNGRSPSRGILTCATLHFLCSARGSPVRRRRAFVQIFHERISGFSRSRTTTNQGLYTIPSVCLVGLRLAPRGGKLPEGLSHGGGCSQQSVNRRSRVEGEPSTGSTPPGWEAPRDSLDSVCLRLGHRRRHGGC
jgi:hypothetical protein